MALKEKLTIRDARLYWEACAASAISGAAAALGDNAGSEEAEEQLVGTAYALADKAVAEWAELWGYDGELPEGPAEDEGV
jgi:hypothetical protein